MPIEQRAPAASDHKKNNTEAIAQIQDVLDRQNEALQEYLKFKSTDIPKLMLVMNNERPEVCIAGPGFEGDTVRYVPSRLGIGLAVSKIKEYLRNQQRVEKLH